MSGLSKEKNLLDLSLQDRAEMFQAVAEISQTGILVIDEHNQVEFANTMVSRIIGYDQDELLGRDFTGFF